MNPLGCTDCYPHACRCPDFVPSWLTPKRAIVGAIAALSLMALVLSSCATVKLAATQCGAQGELKEAAGVVMSVEAVALVCAASGQSVVSCEESTGATLAAKAVVSAPAEVNDVLRCAAALIADAGKAKTVTPTASVSASP